MRKISEFINGKPIILEIHPLTAVIITLVIIYRFGKVIGKTLYYLIN